MSLSAILGLIGGLAFFLLGMHILSTSLKRLAGNRLEGILQKMTDHPGKGLLLGGLITIAMQSSSALTVMLVGLVNSGVMALQQTVGLIMGSNIGTTLTAWLLGFGGLKTDNILLLMLKPENFSPILALLGVILIMAAKPQKLKDLGMALSGFALLMQGMNAMSDSLSPLAENPDFVSMLTAFRSPFLGVLVGTLFTAVIQSSAASVGVLEALSMTGQVSVGTAIPIIMGQNIGTCVTAVLSSIGVSKNAKRVSVIHISFNLIGTLVGLSIFLVLDYGIGLTVFNRAITPFEIAAFHSVFNIATTLLLLPFTKFLVFIAEHVIRDSSEEAVFLDERLLRTPAVAAAECRKKTSSVLKAATEGVETAISLLSVYDAEKRNAIKESEEKVDEWVEECNSFLIKLSAEDVSPREGRMIGDMLQVLGDMERISDYSLNIASVAKKMQRSGFGGGKELLGMMEPINGEIGTTLQLLEEAYESRDQEKAMHMLEKADALIAMIKKAKKAELKLLRSGKGKAESGVYFSEYLTVSRRVVEHNRNIAETLLSQPAQ